MLTTSSRSTVKVSIDDRSSGMGCLFTQRPHAYSKKSSHGLIESSIDRMSRDAEKIIKTKCLINIYSKNQYRPLIMVLKSIFVDFLKLRYSIRATLIIPNEDNKEDVLEY